MKLILILICVICLCSSVVFASSIANYIVNQCKTSNAYFIYWGSQEEIDVFTVPFNMTLYGIKLNVTLFGLSDGQHNISIYDSTEVNTSNFTALELLGNIIFNNTDYGNVASLTLNFSNRVNITANRTYYLILSTDGAIYYNVCQVYRGTGLYFATHSCEGCPGNYGWYTADSPPDPRSYYPNYSLVYGLGVTLKYDSNCSTNWTCSQYASCISGKQLCNKTTDTTNCSIDYTGNLSEFGPLACAVTPSGGGWFPNPTPTPVVPTQEPTATPPVAQVSVTEAGIDRQSVITIGVIVVAVLLIVIVLVSNIRTPVRHRRGR